MFKIMAEILPIRHLTPINQSIMYMLRKQVSTYSLSGMILYEFEKQGHIHVHE